MITSLTCGVVVYDELNDIQTLIPKLKQELDAYEVEWIFVLNHEQSEVRKRIQNWLIENVTGCLCIQNSTNNLGLARQLILEACQNKYLYYTDPDIDLSSGSITQLLRIADSNHLTHQKNPIAGLGGAVIHQSKNIFLQATFKFLSEISALFPFAFQFQQRSQLTTVDHLPTCHLLLDRSIALNLGGFSAQYDRCGEDLDFTHRAFNQGYGFLFLPNSQVIHWQNLSLDRWLRKVFAFGRVQIFTQKLNYKKGIRFYRLLPLILLLIFLVIFILLPAVLILTVIAVLSLAIFRPGFLGVALTTITYAAGELAEIVWPTFEYKNELELQAIRQAQLKPFAELKMHT